MIEADIIKPIECFIFVASFMVWGGFLVFVAATYIVHKRDAELENLKTELHRQRIDEGRVISMFRGVEYTVGYEPNTSMGRIARVARLHWLQTQNSKETK